GDLTANGTPPSNNTSFLTGGLSITGAGSGTAAGGGAGLVVNWGNGVADANGPGGKVSPGFIVNGAVSITETGTALLQVSIGRLAPNAFGNTLGATTITGGTGGTAAVFDGATAVNGNLTVTMVASPFNGVVVTNGSSVVGNESITSTGTGDTVNVIASTV